MDITQDHINYIKKILPSCFSDLSVESEGNIVFFVGTPYSITVQEIESERKTISKSIFVKQERWVVSKEHYIYGGRESPDDIDFIDIGEYTNLWTAVAEAMADMIRQEISDKSSLLRNIDFLEAV